MADQVTFSGKSGAEVPGAVAFPQGEGRAPGLVLIQEWWGLNDHIKSLVDRFAAAGFVVLAPDLYRGTTTRDAGEAGKLMGALDWGRALDDIAGAVRWLLAHERVNGKVGVTGFCMGGALTLKAATEMPEISAAVPFYGIPPQADWSKVRAPIMGHFASRDQWATVAGAEAVKKEVEAHGGSMTVHVYDADHAFVNDTRPEVYSPDNAKLALDRSIAFLHGQLDTVGSAG